MVCGLLCPGCVFDGGESEQPVRVPPAGAVVASPFSPEDIRVLPLTHYERLESGGTRVLLFFELLDQWGDTVKGAGSLGVTIRPTGVDVSDERLAEWEIDLSDLALNAALYDPSTRSYRLALKELPAWLASAAGGGPAMSVEVYFQTLGSDGRSVTLRDRFELGRRG